MTGRLLLCLGPLCLLSSGCTYIDNTLLLSPQDDAGSGGMDAGRDAGDGGDSGPTECTPSAELCNGIDDDCDGVVDGPPANDACLVARPNAVVRCDSARGTCIPLGCQEGFNQCDGNPGNGCERQCECDGNCDDDAGVDADAGADDDGGM